MFGLKIFARVQTFRRVPPVLPRNFCHPVKVDVQFSPTNIRLVWRGSFLLPKGMDTLTDTSRYEVYTWGSSFISSKISSSSSSSRTTFSKTNREIQPTQLWVFPHWKAALRNFVKILPIFPVYHFSDKIFGMQYLISFTFIVYLGTKVWRIMTVKSNRKILGASSMAIREKIFKYFDAQKVIQQISIFFKSIFHIGADCQKGYFEFFSVNDFICHSQKFQLWQTPPSRCLPIPRFFDKYQIFFIKYLGTVRPVRTWMMCIWSKFSKN